MFCHSAGSDCKLLQQESADEVASLFTCSVALPETRGFPSEVCHSWLQEEKALNALVPKEAATTIYSNKSKELTQMLQDLDKGPLSESL